MPPVRFSVSTHHAKLVAVIFSLSEIMPFYSCCKEKKLVYVVIVALFSHQPSSYIKYTKLNMRLTYNIKLVSKAKYIFIFFSNAYILSQLLSGNIWWCVVFLTLYSIFYNLWLLYLSCFRVLYLV